MIIFPLDCPMVSSQSSFTVAPAMDENSTDFSVVLFRPNFMPVSEEHPIENA